MYPVEARHLGIVADPCGWRISLRILRWPGFPPSSRSGCSNSKVACRGAQVELRTALEPLDEDVIPRPLHSMGM